MLGYLLADRYHRLMDSHGYDQYGRLLFYVYTERGESIDETIVREGLARAWKERRDGFAKEQHEDYLVTLEATSRSEGMSVVDSECSLSGALSYRLCRRLEVACVFHVRMGYGLAERGTN